MGDQNPTLQGFNRREMAFRKATGWERDQLDVLWGKFRAPEQVAELAKFYHYVN
jgi:hypothetical protein